MSVMGDPLGEITLNYLRGLPDGSLTKAEVNLLVDYIERLETKLVGSPVSDSELTYFGPDRHAAWCPGEPSHEGPCLDVLLAKIDARKECS